MTTYKDAGVDIDAADKAFARLKPLIQSTFTPGVVRDVGAFGAFYQLDHSRWEQPTLVSSIDGVGTKVKVAMVAGVHDTVGEDLVNHCINDIAVCGAEPLFFLDYFATGKLTFDVVGDIMAGLVRACKNAGIALIGGETAEMPDLYIRGDYDLAGTIIGVVERKGIIDGSSVKKGDILWGIASTGLHTNGYSLARRVLLGSLSGFVPGQKFEQLGGDTIEEALLRIHKCYLPLIRDLKEHVHAFAHVTGGGIEGNTQRVIPEGLRMQVNYNQWDRPPIFNLIQQHGVVPEEDMRATFNLGIGLVVIAPPSAEKDILRIAAKHNENPIAIGSVY